MSKVLLSKIRDDDDDGLSDDDRAMIAKLVKDGPPDDDPEIDELVAMTLAKEGRVEIRKIDESAEAFSRRRGREIIEKIIREQEGGAPPARSTAELAAGVAKVEAGIAKLETDMQMQRTNELAAEALRLTKSGSHENIEKAAALLADSEVYETMQAQDRAAQAQALEAAQVAKAAPVTPAVAELLQKANALRKTNPKLTMAQAMDRAKVEVPNFAKRYEAELAR